MRALVIRSVAHSTIPDRNKGLLCGLIVLAASIQLTYRLSLLQIPNCHYFVSLHGFLGLPTLSFPGIR